MTNSGSSQPPSEPRNTPPPGGLRVRAYPVAALGTGASALDTAHLLASDPAPGVLAARCPGALPTVAAPLRDRPCGSLVCLPCAERAEAGDPFSGWPLVEPVPDPLAPSGQPVPPTAHGQIFARIAP